MSLFSPSPLSSIHLGSFGLRCHVFWLPSLDFNTTGWDSACGVQMDRCTFGKTQDNPQILLLAVPCKNYVLATKLQSSSMDEKCASINEGYPSKLDSISLQPRRTLFKDKLTQRSQLNHYLLASMPMESRVAVA